MHVFADQDQCISSRQCAAVAPGVFDNDEDGIVVVRRGFVPDDEAETAEYAARICPANAILLTRS